MARDIDQVLDAIASSLERGLGAGGAFERLDTSLQSVSSKFQVPQFTTESVEKLPAIVQDDDTRSTALDFLRTLERSIPKQFQGPQTQTDLPVLSQDTKTNVPTGNMAKDFVENILNESRNTSGQFAQDFYRVLTTALPKTLQGPQVGSFGSPAPHPAQAPPPASPPTGILSPEGAGGDPWWRKALGLSQKAESPFPSPAEPDTPKGPSRWERVGAGLDRAVGGLENPNELRGLGQTIGGSVTAFAEAMGGPTGKVVGALGKLAEGLFTGIDRLKKWGEMLHQTNIQFAQFSGAMAGVKARQEIRDIELDRKRGDRRADSAERLAKGQHTFKEFTSEIEDAFGIFRNELGAVILPALGDLGKKFNELIGLTRWLAEQQGKQLEIAAGDWMTDVATEHWTEVYGRPSTWDR